jgi:hypothetical protein
MLRHEERTIGASLYGFHSTNHTVQISYQKILTFKPMMQQHYVMTRRGEIGQDVFSTPNQCKIVGHSKYYYTVAMVFAHKHSLSKDGFLIDHLDIDAEITKMRIGGSCEELCNSISKRLMQLFIERDMDIQAFKLVLTADEPNAYSSKNKAFMQDVRFKEGCHYLLPLLATCDSAEIQPQPAMPAHDNIKHVSAHPVQLLYDLGLAVLKDDYRTHKYISIDHSLNKHLTQDVEFVYSFYTDVFSHVKGRTIEEVLTKLKLLIQTERPQKETLVISSPIDDYLPF